jgi:uncharacterized sulfatase
LPDNPVTRGEFLDYGLEIEHFDQHLARMIAALAKAGELDNTLIVVISEHGNPMPRSKCNLYDSGTRVPLAVRWSGRIAAGRVIEDFIHHADIASTLLDVAAVKDPGKFSRTEFWALLTSGKSGMIDKSRDFAVSAFERHIICRRDGVGYPMLSIRMRDFAYISIYETTRWPAGDPDFNSSPQGFYEDCHRGSSKEFILSNSSQRGIAPNYRFCFGRRPAEELYDMVADPHQLRNLANIGKFAAAKTRFGQASGCFPRGAG